MNRIAAFLFIAVLVVALCGCSSSAAVPETAPTPAPVDVVEPTSVDAGSDGPSKATADTVFGYPEQFESASGSGETLGTVGVFSAPSSECTLENVEKWCNQYVRWGIDDWCVVKYSDKPGFGVYASGSIVEIGVELAPDYSLVDDSEAEFYVFSADDVTEDGKLSRMD